MGVVGGWLLVPLVLTLVVVGHGLVVERLCGMSLPGALVPAVGLAALIAVTGLLTVVSLTAPLASPLAAGVSVLGLVWGRPWRRLLRRGALLTAAVAAAAFVLFAAPSLLTGQASITGYLKLDDSATWLALTGHVVDHGRDLDGLAPSSYRRTLEAWLGGGYPVGAFLPLGVASTLARQDPAGAYQPVMAVYAAILALGIAGCFASLSRTRVRAAVLAVVAVQASTFYGYVHWGGIKEAAAASLLPPLAYLAARSWGAGTGSLIGLGVAGGAVLGVLGINGVVWVAPALALAAGGLVRGWWRDRAHVAADGEARPVRGRRLGAGAHGVVAPLLSTGLVLAAASIPALATITFVRQTTGGGVVSRQTEVGNLVAPLSPLQAGGLWPVADFRFVDSHRTVVVFVAFVCLLSALACVAVALLRREVIPVALAGITATGAAPALAIGSPWVDAKVMAIVSPVVLALAVALAMSAIAGSERPSRRSGAALLAVLVLSAAWSTVAVARDVYAAPRERFTELERLGDELAGEGPTLVLDFEVYANRYFLRRADAEGATDLRYRRVSRRDGQVFPERSVAEIDDVAVGDLWEYRTVVRRRSPVASRPPTGFELVHAGESWEAWQRPVGAPPPRARLPLGDGDDPTGEVGCGSISALAATPGATRLVAAPRAAPLVVPVDGTSAPPSWRTRSGLSASVDGVASTEVWIEEAGSYRVWVGGGVLGRLDVRIDGRPAGAATHELAHAGQWLRFDAMELEEGPHEVELRYSNRLRSGTGFPAPILGPIALTPEEPHELVAVAVASHRDLCDGRTYDWIEAVP